MTQALTNPAGRLDVLLLRLAEEYTRVVIEPAVSRFMRQPVQLWPAVQPIVQAAVKDAGIPARPVTVDDLFALKAPKRRRACTR